MSRSTALCAAARSRGTHCTRIRKVRRELHDRPVFGADRVSCTQSLNEKSKAYPRRGEPAPNTFIRFLRKHWKCGTGYNFAYG